MVPSITIPISALFEATRTIWDAPIDDALTVPIGFLNDLNGAATRQDILGVYSVWVHRLVGADRCSIALADDSGGLIVTAANGHQGIEPGTRHDIATTVWGAVFQRGQSLYVPDTDLLDMPDAAVVRQWFKSAILVPITKGPRRYGAVAASYTGYLDHPAPTLAMLNAMAQCLGTQLMFVEQLEILAGKIQEDALTGAPNRHFLNDQLADVWTGWSVGNIPFSFLSLDIDHFKSVNDTYGHDVGDKVLCEVVNRIRKLNRDDDVLVRLGGEEFGMIVSGALLDAAVRVSHRFRDALKAAPMRVGHVELPVTASFGVAEVEARDTDITDVIKRADQAMYRAKQLGRDRIVASLATGLVQV